MVQRASSKHGSTESWGRSHQGNVLRSQVQKGDYQRRLGQTRDTGNPALSKGINDSERCERTGKRAKGVTYIKKFHRGKISNIL